MTEEPGGRQPISSQSQAQLKQLWGTYMLFFVVASLIYIPTNSTEGFPFLHILINTDISF